MDCLNFQLIELNNYFTIHGMCDTHFAHFGTLNSLIGKKPGLKIAFFPYFMLYSSL